MRFSYLLLRQLGAGASGIPSGQKRTWSPPLSAFVAAVFFLPTPSLTFAAADVVASVSPPSIETPICSLVELTLKAVNIGDLDAENVLLKLTAPGWEFDFDGSDPGIDEVPPGSGCFLCSLGTVPANDFLSCAIRLRPKVEGFTPLVLEVESPSDANGSNNSRLVEVNIQPKPQGAKQPIQPDAGDPVGTFSGNNHFLESPDLNLGGPMPVFLQRSYDSALASDGLVHSSLGDNWQHNFDIHLDANATDAAVSFRQGHIIRFVEGGGSWTLAGRKDLGFQLIDRPSGFVLADPRSQWMYSFDTLGHLTRIEDGRGNSQQLSYSGDLLETVTDGLGRTLTFTYDGADRLVGVTDGTRTVSYSYTGNNLTTFTDADSKATNYAYDLANPSGTALMTSRTEPTGNVPVTQSYNPDGRVATQTDAFNQTTLFDYRQDVGVEITTVTDPLGHTTIHTYKPEGNLDALLDQAGNNIDVFVNSAGRRTGLRDRNSQITSIFYDSSTGLPTDVFYPLNGDVEFSYTTRTLNGISFKDLTTHEHPDRTKDNFAYDSAGNLTTWTLRDGKSIDFSHSPRGQVETVTNPIGGVAAFTYDANARLATVSDSDPFTGTTTYHYDSLHRATSVVHPDTTHDNFTYDPLDRLRSVTDARGFTTRFDYDPNGRLTRVTDPALAETVFHYDDLNRPEQVDDRLGHPTRFTYDQRSQLASVTDRNAITTTFSYDSRQRLIAVTDAGNDDTTFSYDDEGRLTSVRNPLAQTATFHRDAMGYVTGITDPLGHSLTIERDDMKRVTRLFDPLDREVRYTYTPRGQITSALRDIPGGSIDATYTYDDLGNLITLRDGNAEDWTFAYTSMGRLASSTDPLNRAISYQYDSRGRLAATTYPDATSASYSYDAVSNITRILFSDGTDLNYTYDALNRLESASGATENVDISYDPEGRVTNTRQNGMDLGAGYDPGGRLTSVTYPDPSGSANFVTVTYTYDSENHLSSVSDDLTATTLTFGYDLADRLTTITRPNGVHTTYTYDEAGRLTRIQDGSIVDLRFSLDDAGQITTTDFVAVPLDPAASFSAGSATFTVDSASHLSGGGHAHDLRGRQTAAPGNSFSWDGASRLTSFNTVTNTYNALGEIATRADASTGSFTRYLYNAAIARRPVMSELDAATAEAQRLYVWSPGGSLLYLINTPADTPSFPHFDQVGSTLGLTDPSGAVTDAYAYDPYGIPLASSGSNSQPFRFNGRFGVRTDTPLLHMRARWYDPKAARFLTRDPVWPAPADPRRNNPYEFALRNPSRFTDSNGRSPTIPNPKIDLVRIEEAGNYQSVLEIMETWSEGVFGFPDPDSTLQRETVGAELLFRLNLVSELILPTIEIEVESIVDRFGDGSLPPYQERRISALPGNPVGQTPDPALQSETSDTAAAGLMNVGGNSAYRYQSSDLTITPQPSTAGCVRAPPLPPLDSAPLLPPPAETIVEIKRYNDRIRGDRASLWFIFGLGAGGEADRHIARGQRDEYGLLIK